MTTYLPGTTDPGQAQKVDIAPGGDVTGLNIRMRKSVVVRVKGQLTDEAGATITTAQIMTMSAGRNASTVKTVVNNPEGKFELTDLQPGVYTIVTMEMQGATPKMSMHPLLVPARGIENLKLGARPDTTIHVKVTAQGDPEYPLQGFALTLSPADNVLILPANGKADVSGAFTLPNLAPAVYDVVFPFIPNRAYLKSVEFNGREVTGRPSIARLLPPPNCASCSAPMLAKWKRTSPATTSLPSARPLCSSRPIRTTTPRKQSCTDGPARPGGSL